MSHVTYERVMSHVNESHPIRVHASASRVNDSLSMCCSVLQCVAVCCSVSQCVAVCCSVLQCVAGWCRVVQGVAVLQLSRT